MIKRRKLIKVLTKDFDVKFSRQAKGSHEVYQSPHGWAIIHISEELPEGTVFAIHEQLKIDRKELKKKINL
jgi:predicted RNA binding protein YcfA (HicA-like mRNA interferase family)